MMRTQSVHVVTLGGFSVRVNGRTLGFGRKAPRRPLDLLKYLAACGGKETSGAQCAAMLWPNPKGVTAFGSLAVTLHRLRRLIDEPEAVIYRDGRIGLDPALVWCDAVAFERMLDQSAAADRESERLSLTAGALALYRGDFLAGEERPAWIAAQRERLRRRYLLACSVQGKRLLAVARRESVSDL